MLRIAALNSYGSISLSASCWKITANTTANSVDVKSVISGGTRRAIITPVITGTNSNHGVMVKRSESDVINAVVSWLPTAGIIIPITANAIRVNISDGIVVMSIYRMCLNNGTPTLDDAITVVSDNGDTLSPK